MQIMIFFTAAFIFFSQNLALASDENPELNCKRAHADLIDLLGKSTNLENLPANWKIQQELKEDQSALSAEAEEKQLSEQIFTFKDQMKNNKIYKQSNCHISQGGLNNQI